MGGEDGYEGRLEAIIRICEIVNSVGQGNFTFVREKSGKSQGISNTYGCGNHVYGYQRLNFFLSQVYKDTTTRPACTPATAQNFNAQATARKLDFKLNP